MSRNITHTQAHYDYVMADAARPCCANHIPRSTYDQQRVEADMMFHITRLEIEVNTLKGKLEAADAEIRRLRMIELRCACAAGVAELIGEEEFISC